LSNYRPVLLASALAACISAPQPRTESQSPAAQPQPPVARKEPHVTRINGDALQDDYFWLRNKGTPEVESYLRAESAYADALMKPAEALQKTLYAELLSRIQEDDSTPPVRIGSHWYYQRTEKGKQYPILCRKPAPEAGEQVILDVNALAAGKKFLGLGDWELSDDGMRLAYTTDETGFRQYDLHVRDLRSGKDGTEKIARVDSVAWSRDGKVLFYVVEDEQEKRPYQLFRHVVGSSGKDDLVYEEKDHAFNLEVDRSRSKDFIFLTSGSLTSSEVRFFRADDPHPALVLVQPREPGHEYYADARGSTLYIRTNSGGRNFRLVTAPVSAPRKENWTEVVPHRDDVMLLDIDLFANHLVRHVREGGLPQIVVRDLFVENRGDRRGAGRTLERPLRRHHLEEDAAEGEDVGGAVDRFAAELFGRHVAERPSELARARERGAPLGSGRAGREMLREAEVGDERRLPVFPEEHVLGLEIAVDDASLVRGLERLADLAQQAA